MSDSENTDNTSSEETVESTVVEKGNLLSTVMELKDSNPKVFFGAIAAVVVLLLIVMMSGGSDKKLPKSISTNLSIGQEYILKGANSTNEGSTISVASIPGTVSAFDEDGEDGEKPSSCKQIPEGTKVKVLELQKTLGVTYAKVEMLDGECQSKNGWALSIDVQ